MNINNEEPVVESKPVVVLGKDYVVLSHDNTAEVERFLNIKLEHLHNGTYAFPNDNKSRRTFVGDYLLLDGDRVVIRSKKNFENIYEIGK